MDHITADLKYFALQLAAYPPVKATAAAIGGLLGAALTKHTDMLTGLAFLFCIDWAFGVWNAIRTHRVSSAGMRRGISKAVVYIGFISAAAVAEHLTTGQHIITAGVICVAILTELMSIAEHAVALGGRFGGAEKIREWSRAKLALYGVVYESVAASDSVECVNAHDLLRRQVPTIRDAKLRLAAEIYLQEWYHWMCTIKAPDLAGDLTTALSRVRHEIHYVVFNINSHMMRAGLPSEFVKALLAEWLGDLISRMETRARYILANADDLTPAERCRVVRAVALYHLDRFVFGLRALEEHRDGLTPATALQAMPPLADDSDVAEAFEFEPTDLAAAPQHLPKGPTRPGRTTAAILASVTRSSRAATK